MREKLKTLPLVQLREMAKAQGLKGISTLKKAEIIDRLCELEKPAEGGQKEETPQASVSEHPTGSAEPAERTEMHVQPRRTDAGQNTSAQTYSQPRRSANGEREGRISAMSAAAKADTAGMNTAPIHAVRIIIPVIRITADASTRSERGIREIPMCRVTIIMKR